jgi:hypothetical protein
MTLRVPEDLDRLREVAADLGRAPAFVVKESGPDEEWDVQELPILRVQLEEFGQYLEVHTAVPATGPSPQGTLTFGEVVAQLEAFGAESRPLFWVSSLLPLPAETDPEVSRYRVRLALPLINVLSSDDPLSVAFLAQTEGLSPRAARIA